MTDALRRENFWTRAAGLTCRWAGMGGLLLGLGAAAVASGAETGPVRKVVQQYALTSGNDFPQRDPEDWRLLASNDGGTNWTTLDVRVGEVFAARQQRKLYQINNKTAFETYRLQIDRVLDPNQATSVQLAELELMGATENDLGPEPAVTDAISSQGDNPPAETVASLFDGRAETKWLNWATNNVERASWVQWRYLAPTNLVVTNISQLKALRVHAGDGFRVRLPAVVVGRATNHCCLADGTGCLALGGIDGLEAAGPGQTILLTGTSGWEDGRVVVRAGRARPVGGSAAPLPVHISLGQSMSRREDWKLVEVEGNIHYRYAAGDEVSFDLQDGNSSMRVRLLEQGGSCGVPAPGARVVVRGICLGAFNEQGHWVASTLWADGWQAVSIPEPGAAKPAPLPMATEAPVSKNLKTFTPIEQVRRLTPDQIATHAPLRIRGVVTGLLAGFIQDDTAGIEIDFPERERSEVSELGSYIEVDGFAEQGAAGNPMFYARHVVVLGRGKLPPPQRLSLSQLSSGRFDAQWIEEQGVVRATDGAHLLIICEGQELMATLGMAPASVVNGLVDAEVRVRGVGVTATDEEGRIQGIHMLIPSMEDVDVMIPPSDPATLPVRNIGSLLGLNGPRESFHRVKVVGVVTLQANRKVFVQDRTGGAMAMLKQDVVLEARFGRARWLYWQSPRARVADNADEAFHPGERVQVIGFPETSRYSPVLTEVTITRLGGQQQITPIDLASSGVEQGSLDSSLVSLTGILRGQTMIGTITVLALEWEDRNLQIFVPGTENELAIALGSRLRITGVCQVDTTPYPELGLGVGGVRILARSSSDVEVLARPSWWTVRRALVVTGGMAFAVLAAMIWIKELRRQVGERTMQLATEIRLREQTERNRALEQERARIAKDLHDDLGANLTQIVFLSERVEVARHDGQEATRWFELIPATARRTIQSLDEIVWAINPRHDSLESLANYLSQFAQEHLALAGVRCVLDIPMVLPAVPLSAELRHNLLLTAREALQNAVTHASATEVRLTLKLTGESLSIAIIDNGRGFNPALASRDGNGLQNMGRRLEAIGGRLEINSRPGHGTTISLILPSELLHGRVIGKGDVSDQCL